MPTPKLDLYNGRYYAIWSDERRSKRKSMGTTDRAVAEARFGQWLLLGGHRGEVADEAKAALTVADLWTVYNGKHVQRETAAPASIEFAWKNLREHFGGLVISDIDQDCVDEYEEKRADGKIGRPAKSGTVRKELVALRACFNWHAAPSRGKMKLLDKADVPAYDLPEDGEARSRWLTTAEIEALLAAAKAMRGPDGRVTRGERFLWIALETAARKQAILDLTWDRVDFETGMIHFDVPGRRQTKKRRPSVPISNRLLPMLGRMEDEKTTDIVLGHDGEIWSTIQSIVVRAGLAEKHPRKTGERIRSTGISPHTFRHTAATHMARRGVPLYHIAGVLGNSLAMVERVYSKHSPGALRAAVNMISTGFQEAAE